MKLILVMVMLATALSTSGCASRRAAAREAKAAKLAKTTPPVAAAKSATPAPASTPATPAQPVDTAVNTYAVSAIPATVKSAAPVAPAPARAVAPATSRPAAPVMAAPVAVAAVTANASVPAGALAMPRTEPVSQAAQTAPAPTLDNIEKVPFQIGTSSVTVERLAQAAGCAGGKGAGLVTEKGPVEVYRMQCDNGKVFLAKCELRQCAPMRW